MRKIFLAVLGVGLVAVGAQAVAATPGITLCAEEIKSVLAAHGVDAEAVTDVEQIKVGKQQSSVVTLLRPASCESGELRVNMWYTCTLESMHTIGDCSIAGVARAPF